MTLAWTADLAVGVDEIDRQHQEIIRLSSGFLEALRTASGAAAVAALLPPLTACVRHHFETEERLMRTRGYPDLAAHRAEHSRYERELERLAADHQRTGPSAAITLRLAEHLVDHLRGHFCGPDLEIGRFLLADRTSPRS